VSQITKDTASHTVFISLKLSPFDIFQITIILLHAQLLQVVYYMYMCVMFHLYWLHFREMWTDGQDDFLKPPQTLFYRVFTTV